jgi:hypothetical protein
MGRDLGETPDYERYQDRAENDGANHRFNIPARSDRHEDHVSELHVEKIQRIPEPPGLRSARETEKTCRQQLRLLETVADATLQKLSALPRSSMWRRFWFRREARTRKALNDQLTKQLASAQRAARAHATSQNSLDAEIKSFNVARSKHEVENARRVETAKWESSIAAAAKTFVVQNPKFATWGSRRLMQVAAQIEKIRSERDSPEDCRPIDGATSFLPF